jgi:hypothetical protein
MCINLAMASEIKEKQWLKYERENVIFGFKKIYNIVKKTWNLIQQIFFIFKINVSTYNPNKNRTLWKREGGI